MNTPPAFIQAIALRPPRRMVLPTLALWLLLSAAAVSGSLPLTSGAMLKAQPSSVASLSGSNTHTV